MESIYKLPDKFGHYYYPQTHYLAVVGLDSHVRELMSQNNTYATYVKDMRLINTSGPFYFDENTLNKPENIPKGYLQAIFMDSKNGVIEIMTTNNYYEITGGKLSDIKERT